VGLAHHLCPTQSVSRFVFSIRQVGEALSDFDREAATITVFLHAIFQSSCNAVRDPSVSFSLRADIWLAFLRETFKQFYRACRMDGVPIRAECAQLAPVLPKTPELGKLLAYVGINYGIEPPSVKDDPFFGPLIEGTIAAGQRRGEPWAINQRELIYRLFVFPFEMNLAPVAIRDYFKWATGNLDNPDWPQCVPSFNADSAEIEKVARDNRDWQRHLEKWAREDAQFQREMDLLDRAEAKIERMIKEGKVH
jgi:hypothetical protein